MFVVDSVVFQGNSDFARFRVGSDCIRMSHLDPAARQDLLNDVVKKVFACARYTPPSTQGLRISFQGRSLVVSSKTSTQTIDLNIEQQECISKLLQRSLALVRNTQVSQDRAPAPESAPAVARIEQMSDPCRTPAYVKAMGPCVATVSLSKNVLSLAGVESPAVTGLGFLNGVGGLGVGIFDWIGGVSEEERSRDIHDEEGHRRAVAKILYGQTQTAGAALFFAEKGCELSSTSAAAIAGISLGTAALFFSGVASITGLFLSSLGMWRCAKFRERIDEYFTRPNLTEEQRVIGALRFLQDLISVTPEERLGIEKMIENQHPEKSPAEQKELIEKTLSDLVETKVAYVKRRSSIRSLRLIMDKSDGIIQKIQEPKTRAVGITEGKELIQAIHRQSVFKACLYAIGAFAGLLGMAALIAGIICTCGTLPLALASAAALIWLALAIYNVIAPHFKHCEAGYGALPAADGQHIPGL